MPIRLTGVEQTISGMGKSKGKIQQTMAEVLDKAADIILKKAKYYVPKDTLALEKSGRKETTGKGMGAKTTVAFGGKTAPHAMVVHERPAKHAKPTTHKYLERATRESRGTITAMMKRQVRVSMAQGKK